MAHGWDSTPPGALQGAQPGFHDKDDIVFRGAYGGALFLETHKGPTVDIRNPGKHVALAV